jgi:GWxTD domain-containing protein
MKKLKYIKYISVFMLILSALLLFSNPAKGKKIKLDYKYKKFIQEISPIITPTEQKIFYKLKTNKERDEFIKLFWTQRDPTPLTAENEFKEEYYKRLKYVNNIFGREEGKPGWATERGKYYLLLGPPKTIDRYDGMGRLYPTEVWFYSVSPKYGVPAAFNLVFYKPDWSNEYLLYSPNQDGPGALIGAFSGDKNDYKSAYEYIKIWSPALAPTTISLIPTENATEISSPPLSNITLVNNIKNIPRKQIDENYIKRYYELKPKVEVDYSLRYIESKGLLFYTIEQAKKIGFVNILIQPKRFSIERYDDKFYTKLGIIIKVYDKITGRELISFNKDQFLDFNKKQVFELKRRKINIGLKFPIIFDRDLKLLVFIKNHASKEYFILEKEINLPNPFNKNYLIDQIVAFRFKKVGNYNLKRPFQAHDIIISPSINNEFYGEGKAFLVLGVNSVNKQVDRVKLAYFNSKGDKIEKEEEINIIPKKVSYITKNLSEKIKKFGYHKIRIELLNNNIILDSKEFSFLLSPLKSPLKPFMIFPQFKELNIKEIFYFTALQYFKIEKNDLAKKYINNILILDSKYEKGIKLKTEILYVEKDYKKGLSLLDGLDNIDEDILFLRFFGNFKIGNLEKARGYGEKLLKKDYEKTGFLNDMGRLYLKLKMKEKAIQIFRKSLKIKANQKEIKKIINKTRK